MEENLPKSNLLNICEALNITLFGSLSLTWQLKKFLLQQNLHQNNNKHDWFMITVKIDWHRWNPDTLFIVCAEYIINKLC